MPGAGQHSWLNVWLYSGGTHKHQDRRQQPSGAEQHWEPRRTVRHWKPCGTVRCGCGTVRCGVVRDGAGCGAVRCGTVRLWEPCSAIGCGSGSRAVRWGAGRCGSGSRAVRWGAGRCHGAVRDGAGRCGCGTVRCGAGWDSAMRDGTALTKHNVVHQGGDEDDAVTSRQLLYGVYQSHRGQHASVTTLTRESHFGATPARSLVEGRPQLLERTSAQTT